MHIKRVEMKDLGKTNVFVLNSKLNISEKKEYLCINQTIQKDTVTLLYG